MDERFILHRYKSTSHAAMAGGVLLGGFFFYYRFARGETHREFALILAAMVVTKLASLLYYRLRD